MSVGGGKESEGEVVRMRARERKSPGATEESSACVPRYLYQRSPLKVHTGRHGDVTRHEVSGTRRVHAAGSQE